MSYESLKLKLDPDTSKEYYQVITMLKNFPFDIHFQKPLRQLIIAEQNKFRQIYQNDTLAQIPNFAVFPVRIVESRLTIELQGQEFHIGQIERPDSGQKSPLNLNSFFQANVNGESGINEDEILGNLMTEIETENPEVVFISAINTIKTTDFYAKLNSLGYTILENYLEFKVQNPEQVRLGNALAIRGNQNLELKLITGSGVVPHWLYDHLTIQERVEQLGYPAWSILVAVDPQNKLILANTYLSPFEIESDRVKHLSTALESVRDIYSDYKLIFSGDFNTFGTMAHPYWQYETLGKRGFLIGNLASYLAGYNIVEEDEIKNLLAETDSKLKLLSPPQTTFVGISKLERAVAEFMKLNIDKTITNLPFDYRITQMDIGSDHTLQKYTTK